jgi:hypothetical protein
MATVLVSIAITAPTIGTRSKTRTVEIPPDYDQESRREFFVHWLGRTNTELIEEQGWIDRIREAALANDAKITRIEELLTGEDVDPELRDQITEVILTEPAEAIALWGEPENE